MTDAQDPAPRLRESHIWTRDERDFYVEPEWCSERLFQLERFDGSIWEPACGLCRISISAMKAGYRVWSSDIVERHVLCDFEHDFLMARHNFDHPQNIIANPPFSCAEVFVRRACELARGKVAMLLPYGWMYGDQRSRWLEISSLARVYHITPRPSMPPGHVILAGGKPANGTTDYLWLVFDRKHSGDPLTRWLRRDP